MGTKVCFIRPSQEGGGGGGGGGGWGGGPNEHSRITEIKADLTNNLNIRMILFLSITSPDL